MTRRMIDFEGLVNCRDLGGLPCEGSKSIRSGVLFRSETPQLMTPADVVRARDVLGIGRVVDLRGAVMMGKDLGGSGPLGEDGRARVIDFLELVGGLDGIDYSPDGFLPNLLTKGGKPLEAFLTHFVGTDEAVLVHCHGGKDRTGFIVAMTLALAGVSEDAIIADYEMSGQNFEALMANLKAGGMGVPSDAPAQAKDRPSSEGIRRMLSRIRSDWSTAANWAIAQGISQNLIERTRARLVV